MTILSSLPQISGLTIFFGCLTSFILFLIFNFIVVPLKNLDFYKKQGIKTSFIPVLGLISVMKKSEKEQGDNLHYFKNNAHVNPDLEIEGINVASKAFLLIYSPRLLKAFFSSIDPYEKYKSLQPITLFSKWGFPSLTGRMFRQHRKTVSTMFSYTILGDKVPTMQANARKILEDLSKNGNLQNVDILDAMFTYAGDNVGDLFFGGHIKNYSINGNSVVVETSEIQNESGLLTRTLPLILFGSKILKLGLLKSHRNYNARVQNFRSEVTKLIKDRKAKTDQVENDLLKVLLDTQKSTDPDTAYTDEMILDEYISLFVAGAENPAHLIVLALYLLNTHPEYKKQILDEISEIYDKEPLSSQTLHKMNYLQGLIQESLRLQSPSFSSQPRVAVKDFNIENYQIKKGTLMMPIFFHQNYSDKVFEDAFKFKPERWVDGSLSLEPFRFIPFSAGPRNCVGQHYAQLEIKVMICEFLKMFEYNVDPNYKLLKTQKFLNVPKEPIPFNLKVRE